MEGPDAERLPAEETKEASPQDGHTAIGERQGLLERVSHQAQVAPALRQDDAPRQERQHDDHVVCRDVALSHIGHGEYNLNGLDALVVHLCIVGSTSLYCW